MTTSHLILRYGAFAVLATLANLLTQRLVLAVAPAVASPKISFGLALVFGTGAGLVLKYVLDKRWIFLDAVQSLRAEAGQFWRYTATGIATTLVFWGTETWFWLVWQTDLMRETGAILGLAMGYVLKYNLDKRFVFSTSASFAEQKPPASDR